MMEPTKLVDEVNDSDISDGSDSDHVDTDELDDSPHRNLCKDKMQENTLKKRKCKLKEKRRRYSKDVDAPKSAESRHREVEEISKMMAGMSSRSLVINVYFFHQLTTNIMQVYTRCCLSIPPLPASCSSLESGQLLVFSLEKADHILKELCEENHLPKTDQQE